MYNNNNNNSYRTNKNCVSPTNNLPLLYSNKNNYTRHSTNTTAYYPISSRCSNPYTTKISVLNYSLVAEGLFQLKRFQGIAFNRNNNINAIFMHRLNASPSIIIRGENIHLLEPGIYNFNMNIIVEGTDEIEYIAFSMIRVKNNIADFSAPIITEKFPVIIIGQLSTTMSISINKPITIRIINTSVPKGAGTGAVTLISSFNPKAVLNITGYTLGYKSRNCN